VHGELHFVVGSSVRDNDKVQVFVCNIQ
jgi:hypothetical protein